MKTKSDYTWTINDEIIEITDLNRGRMSVTNDIENVLAAIREELELSEEAFRDETILVRNSNNLYDVVDYINDKNVAWKVCDVTYSSAMRYLEYNDDFTDPAGGHGLQSHE